MSHVASPRHHHDGTLRSCLLVTATLGAIALGGCTPEQSRMAPVTEAKPATTAATETTATPTVPAPEIQPTAPEVQPTAPAAATIVAEPPLEAGIHAVVHYLAQKPSLHGDAADWAAITALPVPFLGKAAGSVKLGWREDGLYGCAQIADTKIVINEKAPWLGDAVELWLEPGATHRREMNDSVQVALAANPKAGAGPGIVMVAQGIVNAKAVEVMWKQSRNGYTVEFFLPVQAITFAEGSKIGFNYAVDNDGAAIEQFFSDKNVDEGYSNPSTWGTIKLVK